MLRTEEKAVKQLLGEQNLVLSRVQFYERMYYSGHIFSTKSYSSKFIQADYAVSISTKNCVEINNIVVINGNVFFLGETIPSTKFSVYFPHVGPLCSNILTVSDDDTLYESKIIAFRPVAVTKKFVILPIPEKNLTYFIQMSVSEY